MLEGGTEQINDRHIILKRSSWR